MVPFGLIRFPWPFSVVSVVSRAQPGARLARRSRRRPSPTAARVRHSWASASRARPSRSPSGSRRARSIAQLDTTDNEPAPPFRRAGVLLARAHGWPIERLPQRRGRIPHTLWNGKLMMIGRDRSGTSFDLGRMAVALSGGFATASLDEATPAAHSRCDERRELLAAYFGESPLDLLERMRGQRARWTPRRRSIPRRLRRHPRRRAERGRAAGRERSRKTPPQLGLEAYRARGARCCSTTRQPARRPLCCRCARTPRFM